ncbi:MAG: helix-turn-helix domain-containing protein, partial [Chloroflexota bacterium]
MSARAGDAFGKLLKRYRLAAALTQEALAERARLGVRSIQALEGGGSRPQRDTVRRLVAALVLDEGDRTRFAAAGTPAPRGIPAGSVVAPPPRHALNPRHNLPRALSSLVGREAERREVPALLGEARLVTLTGSGGVGKTRLALAVAGELVDHYPDGVWLVELAAQAEPVLVPGAVAAALDVREEPGRLLTATLQDSLRDRRLLLVLDNCEHLVAACAALVGALLRACPHLRILATSREGLE